MTTGVQIAAGGSSWAVISNRNQKENFRSLSGEDVLKKLRAVPVTEWQYKDEVDRTTRHVGPMAQDFQKAFKLTADDKTINMHSNWLHGESRRPGICRARLQNHREQRQLCHDRLSWQQ